MIKAMEEKRTTELALASDRRWYPVAKRIFDVCFAAFGLLLFAPFGLLIAVAIKVTSAVPVFYRQQRVGLNGQLFEILKFRSMIPGADKVGPAVTKEADPRVTPIGRLLRRTKLDEVPQLWNVLMGEMSFVGPRPEVPRYVDQYTAEQRRILAFKPGITDLATLVFRDEETLLRNAKDVEAFYVQHCIPRKLKLNAEYARRASLWEDVLLILETLCPYWAGVVCGYVLILATSLWLAYQLRFDFNLPPEELASIRRTALLIIPLQLFVLLRGRQMSGLLSYFDVTEMKRLASGLALATAAQMLVWFITQGDLMPGRSIILINGALAFLMLIGLRTGLKNLRRKQQSRIKPSGTASDIVQVGMIGAGELGGWLARQMNSLGKGRRRVVVFFDDDPDKWNLRLCDVPVVGMPECISDGSWSGKLDEVILAIPGATPERQQQILAIVRNANIRARTLTSVDELLTE